MSKETGGNAFSVAMREWRGSQDSSQITVRDYFAAKALAHPYAYHDSEPKKAAEWAYALADAMLEARKT